MRTFALSSRFISLRHFPESCFLAFCRHKAKKPTNAQIKAKMHIGLKNLVMMGGVFVSCVEGTTGAAHTQEMNPA